MDADQSFSLADPVALDQHHVGHVDRPLLLDHATDLLRSLGVADLLGAHVALDDVQPLHVHLVLLGVDAQCQRRDEGGRMRGSRCLGCDGGGGGARMPPITENGMLAMISSAERNDLNASNSSRKMIRMEIGTMIASRAIARSWFSNSPDQLIV